MSKLLTSFLAVFVTTAVSATSSIRAFALEIDGINYTLDTNAKTATVTGLIDGKYSGGISIPSEIVDNEISYKVTRIGYQAFAGCSNITAITIPASICQVGSFAFMDCTSLSSLVFSDSQDKLILPVSPFADSPIKHIYLGRNVSDYSNTSPFYPLLKLAEIEFGPYVTELPQRAFTTSAISSLVLPPNIKLIRFESFRNCPNLEAVEVSLSEIDSYSFYDCKKLKSFTCTTLNPPVLYSKADYNQVFSDETLKNCTLYVPEESIESYKTAQIWKDFENIKPMPFDYSQGGEKSIELDYINQDGETIKTESISCVLPAPEIIPGYKFLNWEIVAGDLRDGIHIQALYIEDTTSIDSVEAENDSRSVEKVIIKGHVYILKNNNIYDINGIQHQTTYK